MKTKKKRGPYKKPEMKRTRKIIFNTTQQEFQRIVERANGQGDSVSNYIRNLALHFPTSLINISHENLQSLIQLNSLLSSHGITQYESIVQSFEALLDQGGIPNV